MSASMWKHLKQDFRRLRDGRPGERFIRFAEERRKRRGGGWNAERIFTYVLGILLIVVGLGIGWLPGPGGFVAILGVAILAQEFPLVARAMDWIEVQLRRAWRSLIRLFRRRPDATRS